MASLDAEKSGDGRFMAWMKETQEMNRALSNDDPDFSLDHETVEESRRQTLRRLCDSSVPKEEPVEESSEHCK